MTKNENAGVLRSGTCTTSRSDLAGASDCRSQRCTAAAACCTASSLVVINLRSIQQSASHGEVGGGQVAAQELPELVAAAQRPPLARVRPLDRLQRPQLPARVARSQHRLDD